MQRLHSRATALLAAGALVLLAAGRAQARAEETASFRTDGGAARVYLDGKYVGDTPLDLEVPCNEVTNRQYRIERDGCAPAKGTLQARLGAGRVVGAVFSAGIALLVKCPNYFLPVKVDLDCGSVAPQRPLAVEELPPSQPSPKRPPTPRPAAARSNAEIEARLAALKRLRDQGAISEAEYESRRARLLLEGRPTGGRGGS